MFRSVTSGRYGDGNGLPLATGGRQPCSRQFQQRWLAGLLTISLLGCGYPDVSPATYELAKAMHSAFNAKSEKDLPVARKMIEERFLEGLINAEERDWLLAMVKQAEDGHWTEAEAEVRRLIADQVR